MYDHQTPIWILMYLSPFLLLNLTFNYILDALVMLILIKAFKVKMKRDVLFRMFTVGWILGFVSEGFSIVFLIVSNILYKNIDNYNIYTDIKTTVIYISTVLINGFLICILTRYLFVRVAIAKKTAYRMAIIMSLVTSPWLLLIPTTTWFEYF